MTMERHINYEALAQDAMRGVVRSILARVAKGGLPGEHHFYIAFNTQAPGIIISKRLRERYPEEMTVVLQHRFWDLTVSDDRFEVKLTFDGIPERLAIPFAAIKVFFDPSVPYGLQFEEADLGGDREKTDELRSVRTEAFSGQPERGAEGDEPTGLPSISAGRPEKKVRAPRKPRTEKAPERVVQAIEKAPTKPLAKGHAPEIAANDTKVISLDKFRKK